MPGRVWSTGTLELQTNVQDLPQHVFLRNQVAKRASLCGAVGVPILGMDEQIIGVLCAFVDVPLHSERGLNIMLHDISRVQFAATQISRAYISDPMVLDASFQSQMSPRLSQSSTNEFSATPPNYFMAPGVRNNRTPSPTTVHIEEPKAKR